jgi:hypothetical protein
MASPHSDEQPVVKPFSAYVLATNNGKTHALLSEKLHDVTEAVLRTGKAGTLALTVRVEPDDIDSRRLSITEAVVAKLPQGTAKKSVFWADADGNLVRSDPNQLQFGDLHPVDSQDRKAL